MEMISNGLAIEILQLRLAHKALYLDIRALLFLSSFFISSSALALKSIK